MIDEPDIPISRDYLLIFTGSQSLAKRPGADGMARNIIDGGLNKHAHTVYAGDAIGPDTWAKEQATLRCSPERPAFWIWSLLGVILEAYPEGPTPPDYWASADERDRVPAKKWPLLRNVRMLGTAALARDQNCTRVRVVALLDPDSPTHGTEHTVSCALRLNLPVTAWRWTGKIFQCVIPQEQGKPVRDWALDRRPPR